MSMITRDIRMIETFIKANNFKHVRVVFKNGKWIFRGEK